MAVPMLRGLAPRYRKSEITATVDPHPLDLLELIIRWLRGMPLKHQHRDSALVTKYNKAHRVLVMHGCGVYFTEFAQVYFSKPVLVLSLSTKSIIARIIT